MEIALVALELRLPGGVGDDAALQAALRRGRSLLSTAPAGRRSRGAPTRAGWLESVDRFDAHAFGIPPAEARSIDPQHRLLWTATWRAVDRWGRGHRSLAGAPIGVFAATGLPDWAERTRSQVDAWTATSSLRSVAAGRLAHHFDLRGPAISLDTACSSGLVAVHEATRALREGRIDTAIVGGANLILSAAPTRAFEHLGALSPTGRSLPFDARADGYVRAEAVVVVILRRLDAALIDGDPILAVLRGSAVNHDGRTNAPTAPSGAAQQAVLRAALREADVDPADVGAVESHGTGTPLGDPIEAEALHAVLGAEGEPVYVGAAKAVFGHSEPVSGLVGLAAAVVRMRTRRADPIAGLAVPNPRLPAGITRLRFPTQPAAQARPFVAVQSFGLAGTNASVIVGPAPAAPERATRAGVTVALWSAPTPALVAAAWTNAPDAPWPAAAAASSARADGRFRAFAVARDRPDPDTLARAARDHVHAPSRPPSTVWVFTGQGSTRPRMGLQLAAADPAFASALDALDPSFRAATGRALRDALARDDVVHTRLAQPTLAALQIALARAAFAVGLRPDAVMGHSAGEIAALVVAGVIDAHDAIAFAARRGEAMAALPDGGGMLAVFAPRDALPDLPDLDVAALNAPRQVVLAGDLSALEAARTVLATRGVDSVLLSVARAFHSRRMDAALAAIDAAARAMPHRPPDLPVYAALSGARAGAWITEPAWWAQAARRPVRFADAVRAAEADGHSVFLEVGPSPQLRQAGMETAPAITWIPSLEANRPEDEAWLTAMARLWQEGCSLDTRALVGTADPAAFPPTPLAGDAHRIPSEDDLRVDLRVPVAVRVEGTIDGAPWCVQGTGPDAARWRRALGHDPTAPRRLVVVHGVGLPPPSEPDIVYAVRSDDDAGHALAAAIRCRRAAGGGGGVVRFDDDATDDALRAAPLVAADGVHARADGLWTQSLVAADPTPGGVVPPAAIITGCTGAIGRALTAVLLARGCSRVVGVARSASPDADTVAGDVADDAVVDAAVAKAGPGAVVFHLAGTAPRGADPADFRALRRVRVEAVDAFRRHGCKVVATSSVSALWGAPDLDAYAAVAAQVAARADEDVRVVALGPVSGGMMAERDLLDASRLGLHAMTPDEAAEALVDALEGPVLRAAGAWDWERLAATATARGPRALFGTVQPVPAATASGGTIDEVLRDVLGHDALPDLGWFDQGLDSVGAVELAARLGRLLGRPLPPTLTFDHGTPARLAAWLRGDSLATPSNPRPSNDVVAVCGMAVRLPGAPGLEPLWQRLVDGTAMVGAVPADREWPSAGALPGSRVGAFLADLFDFDPEAFGITPREAEAMDPQHRLLLDLAVDAIADAGLTPDALLGTRTGIWVGIGRSEYWERIADPGHPAWATSGTGNEPAFAAGRLAWWLGTRGPALAVNTACSSSLVALHHAVRAIRSGEVDRALVAGVNALLDPADQDWVASSGALSPSGSCRPFDAAADGYVRGEGGGVVLLARERDAQAAGLPILARIIGTAVNHDGRGPGLTVPSGEAQRALLRDALADASAQPHQVVAVEAHGTGTRLGDPIEAGALRDVYGDRDLLVGSVKSVVGHLETAAGMASLARAVTSLQRGRFAPGAPPRTRNPALPDWAARFPHKAEPLPDGIYALSAFGMSGTNAHVLLRRGEATRPAPHAPLPRQPRPLRLPRRRELPLWAEAHEHGLPVPDAEEAVRIAHDLASGALGRLDRFDALVRGLATTARAERPDRDVPIPRRALRPLPPSGSPPLVGTWVVTGASGALGRVVSAWLADQGAQVVGVCRRPADLDPRVRVVLADVGDVDAIATAAAEPTGVLHLAGRAVDGLLRGLRPEDLLAARAPKALAAERLARRFPRARHVWFGSAVTRRGRAGTGAYAAANAELEDLAHRCRDEGIAATTVAWGPWAGLGMARALQDWGDVSPHSAEAGLAALARIVACDAPVVVAMDGPTEDALPSASPPRLDRKQAERIVDEAVRAQFGIASPSPHTGFSEMGMDSVTAVALARNLSDRVGRRLPPTVAFDHPSIAALARHLADQAAPDAPLAPASPGEIAIVGVALRFPGASDLDTLEALIHDGRFLPGEVPPDRWDVHDVPPAARFGAFLSDVDQFDAAAFGLSPRQAPSLDPQQRILLQLAREAAERAGRWATLRDSRTGTFLGLADRGYLRRFRPASDLYGDAWAGTGNEPAFAAGRLAHHFALRGPAITVDTTCSSALVALHLAARSLRDGESDQAFAGAASFLWMPDDAAYLAGLGALSPTGRCHAFRAAADGYVRGEGAAVFLLRRLADAQRDGDPILAVIAGSAVNHDGASSGLTVPHGPAQSSVIRAALADAGWSPDDVDAIEAHGTGTPLGDPIEWSALHAVFGGRTAPLPVGAVKAHVGHLEIAAGAVSVAKAIVALRARSYPPQPDAGTTPNERLQAGPLVLCDVPAPMPRGRVGVSAFGLSGTNAHVLLRAGPQRASLPQDAATRPAVLLWSAPTEASATSMGHRIPDLAGVAYSLRTDRGAEAFRACRIVMDGPLAGPPDRVAAVPGRSPRVVFLCTGQGAQHAGMLRDLRCALPIVDDAFATCAAVLEPLLGRPLDALFDDEVALARTDLTQPALFVVGWCLAAAWRSVGVQPDAVAGHSAGELLAATLAGVFDLPDALRLVAARGRRMAALPPGSGMLVVHAGEQAVRPLAVGGAEVADLNHPEETVLAGPDSALAAAAEEAARLGLRTTRLRVSHAFHSAWMDPALDGWQADVEAVTRRAPRLPFGCNLTGRVNGSDWTDPRRWRAHARQPVRFSTAIESLADAGFDVLVDLGPHPVLLGMAQRTLAPGRAVGVASQRRGEHGHAAWLRAVGDAWCAGLDVACNDAPSRVPLPPTPLHPVRTWLPDDRVAASDPTWEVCWQVAQPGPRTELVRDLADSPPRPQDAVDALMGVLQRVRRGPPAWWALRGATGEKPDPVQAAVWGLLRCLRVEAPGTVLGQVDLEGTADEIIGGPPEPEARWRGGWQVPRLRRAPQTRRPIDTAATWILTGASGAIAASAAVRLADAGVRNFVLLSRSLPDVATTLVDRGLVVDVVRADVTDANAVRDAVGRVAGPVAVLHAAGITRPMAWTQVTRDDVAAIAAAKIAGSIVLADAVAGRDLRAFVVTSSIAGVWGSRDLAPYAAANAFAEAVALGVGGSAVAMGPWAGGGMVDEGRADGLMRRGLRLLAPQRAVGALLGAAPGHRILCAVDWSVAAPLLTATADLPLLHDVAPTAPPSVAQAVAAVEDPAAVVLRRVREVLRLRPDQALPTDRRLHDVGYDSLMATELKNLLLADGVDAPMGRLLGGPSVDEIVEMVAPRAPGPPPAATASPAAVLVWTHVAAGIVAFGLGVLWSAC